MLSAHDQRIRFLEWVQQHAIYRRGVPGAASSGRLVSDNEAVEELLDCTLIRTDNHLAQIRLDELSSREQMAVEIVAYELTSKCGAYNGSPSDAVTDAIGIVRAAGFVL